MFPEAEEVEGKMSKMSLSDKVRNSIIVLILIQSLPFQSLPECNMMLLAPIPLNQKLVLASLPPDYQALPCKPLFFDLALNHVEFPSLAHQAEKKPGGITGLVKGWIWGSKS